jgi:hypothetical protein
MYVERIPNRNSPPAILLRESYRDGDKIRKRTLANLSDWPAPKIEALRRVLRGDAWPRSVARRCRCNAACPMVMSRRRWEPCASSGSTGCCRRAAGSPSRK